MALAYGLDLAEANGNRTAARTLEAGAIVVSLDLASRSFSHYLRAQPHPSITAGCGELTPRAEALKHEADEE